MKIRILSHNKVNPIVRRTHTCWPPVFVLIINGRIKEERIGGTVDCPCKLCNRLGWEIFTTSGPLLATGLRVLSTRNFENQAI
jgi:hypothetical protein